MQQGLLSAFNPSDALPAPRYTGMLLPIERDMYGTKGNFELAVPQFLQDAYSGINKFGQAFRGELSPQEIQQLAFDTSMNVTSGSLLGSRVIPNAVPEGILGMGVSNTPKQTGLLGKPLSRPNYAELRREANIQRFGYDPNEVVDTSYRLQHKPNPDGARLDDMTKGGEVFPDDIYSSNGLLYYGNPKSLSDRQSFEVIQKVKGNPDAEVTIYRAVPNQDNITTINSGDFVTLSEDYAKLHGQSGYGVDGSEAGKILSKKVKVRDLFSEGNDLNEFGYFPSKETTSQTGLLGKVDNVQPKSGVSEVVPPTDKADGIIAFHGSPYDFNKFSLSKINTGEGAQAFGNGLYFSSKEDIAKFYRDSVRGYRDLQGKFDYKYKGKDFYTSPAEAKTQEELGVARIIEHARQISKHPEEAKKQLIIGLSREADKAKKIDDEELQGLLGFSYSKELDAVKSIDTSDLIQSKGSMYQVKLNTINDDLIDYDKPLGQQSENIKNILNKMKSEVNLDDARNFGVDPDDYGSNLFNYISRSSSRKDIEQEAIKLTQKMLFGKDEDVVRFLNNWSAIRGEQASGEKLLAKYGAKGIQYLDNASRGKRFDIKLSTNKGAYDHEPIQSGDRNQIEKLAEDYRKKGFKVKIEEGGDKNYVIFDDKIIDIMKKYGIVGAVGVTAMQGGEQSPEADLSL